MTERDVVLIYAWDKLRPAVLLQFLEDGEYAAVIVGSGSSQKRPFVLVRADSPDGQALRVTKDTYFSEHTTFIEKVSSLRPAAAGGVCPVTLFLELRKTAEAWLASLEDDEDTTK